MLGSRRCSRGSLLALLTVVAFVAAACGDDGDRPEVAYADEVCGAVQTWREGADELFADLDLAELARDGRDAITDRLDSLRDLTTELVDTLRETGLPETESSDAARDEIDRLADEVDALATTVADGADALTTSDDLLTDTTDLLDDVLTQITEIRGTFERLADLDVLAEVRVGFEDSEVCDGLLAG